MDSNLQNKLQQFSATPPDGVWNKIADALDAGEGYPQRLFHYEEQPPAAAWQPIENALDAATPAKVVPFTTRFKKPLRYIAAASIIAVILVTITLTVKRTEAGALQADSNTTVPENNTDAAVQKAPDVVNNSSAERSESQRGDNSKENPGKEVSAKETELSAAENKTIKKRDGNTAVYSSLNKYVFFSDGDGKLRKVSKKLASLVQCKDGDAACQQRLQQLRQKMAANAMTTDFTGILEMLHQLQ